jgi:DNA-binding NarL/FixJ family response regulator
MHIRLVMAMPEQESQKLMQSLFEAAMCLIPLDISVNTVETKDDLLDRVVADLDDVIVLDWPLAREETPDLVRTVLRRNPRMRLVALLPMALRQYRQATWDAGACNSIPKELIDQEWLSSLLCVINRAMEREARILNTQSANPPLPNTHSTVGMATCLPISTPFGGGNG